MVEKYMFHERQNKRKMIIFAAQKNIFFSWIYLFLGLGNKRAWCDRVLL